MKPAIIREGAATPARYLLCQRINAFGKRQQGNRMLWLGLTLVLHGCVFTPLSAMAIYFTGGNFVEVIAVMLSMMTAFVTNLVVSSALAAIMVLGLSVVVDVVLVLIAAIF